MKCPRAIATASLTMQHTTFNMSVVEWCCVPTSSTDLPFHEDFLDVDLASLRGCTEFRLIARMKSVLPADNAWQHTQLFRTKLDGSESPFEINLEFE